MRLLRPSLALSSVLLVPLAVAAGCGSSNDDSPGASPDGGGTPGKVGDGGAGTLTDSGSITGTTDGGAAVDAAPPPGKNGLETITVSPGGTVLTPGTTQQLTVTCTYVDGSHDACTRAGGLSWSSSRTTALTVSAAGLATWVTDPAAGSTDTGYAIASAGGLTARGSVWGQHKGDTFYVYGTPDQRSYTTAFPLTVGATATLGEGLVINNDASQGQSTGQPFSESCTWSSANPAIATVDEHGFATAVAPGMTTITCGQSGNATYGKSALSGWSGGGTTFPIQVSAGGAGGTTWYVRPDGGTPFTTAAATPNGQCDGKSDAAYPGTGTNQHCAFGNLRYLWSDEVSYGKTQWVIAGGDTVLIAPNPKGYNTGLDAPSPYQTPAGKSWQPINCNGNPYCSMPSIPSGTAAKPTRILGTSWQSCRDDSMKTKLNVSYAASQAFDVTASQFVQVACFEISDQSACATNGNYSHACNHDDSSYGSFAVLQSALSSQISFTDLNIHGLAGEAVHGATGAGVVYDHVRMAGSPEAGFDMDDAPWNSSNISQAGGLTMTNSTIEFSGCVEEYPVVHQVPYIECRDQNTGGYADGFGTGSTTGTWVFDHDTFRYNFQDGLDLLHSGMQSLTITDSISYGNDGATYKVGSADQVTFRNNLGIANCARILSTIGDEPASAIVPGVSPCRANGDGQGFHFTDLGVYLVQFNTFVGYGDTPYDFGCEGGWDFCKDATAIYQNNIVLGYVNPSYNSGKTPALFYPESTSMPPLDGWSVRDHNLFQNVRDGWCPSPLGTGETCNTADPGFVGEPASPIKAESVLDNFDSHLTAGSPAVAAGVAIAGVTTDSTGFVRANPPSLGAVQSGAP